MALEMKQRSDLAQMIHSEHKGYNRIYTVKLHESSLETMDTIQVTH